jgi:hypothetical protein
MMTFLLPPATASRQIIASEGVILRTVGGFSNAASRRWFV